ncbi:sigma-70 family RNA polymerase sigma factor [Aeoliella sp. ICT_H6.2]|uniref:Sigma-70 family RNA polymerase sigma factor n=1 Tax=Aeoliella straminimaris TaxID=2954799 RepID=A0A9X2JE71_9BACT|nr:sigma-70 family RNA polymerase sigma factor [Aeoliella straminimaris]MCO6042685.1 sigma-70 family RNA polymerase sigma factor [Aeoliella straminimaris]
MPDGSLSIAQLIADAKSGDAVALEQLLTQYRPFLRIIAEQKIGPALRRRHDGSDIVQQTCVEAVTAFPAFRGATEPELSAWLKQILRRNVANLVRDNRAAKRDLRRETELDRRGNESATLQWFEPAGEQSSPSQRAVRGEDAIELAQAIESLPDDQRRAVQLRYLEARSLDEIGEALDRSSSAVAGLLHRGMRSLKSKLEPT